MSPAEPSTVAVAPPEPRLEFNRIGIIGAGPFARAIVRIAGGSLSQAPEGTSDPVPKVRLRVFVRQLAQRPELAGGLEGAELSSDLSHVVKEAEIVVLAAPAGELDDIAARLGPLVQPDQVALIASRGITEGFVLPFEHLRRETCLRKIGVLGGPLNVSELRAGRRINVVIATRFPDVLQVAKRLARDARVSFESSGDLVGVSIAGAIANVAAIAAGLAEAFEMGETARGVLVARGVFEARLLGLSVGAQAETFAGLAGLGELIPRDVRSMERHESLGRALASAPPKEALAQMTGHVEGVATARAVRTQADLLGLSVPLVRGIANILDGSAEPHPTIDAILSLPLARR